MKHLIVHRLPIVTVCFWCSHQMSCIILKSSHKSSPIVHVVSALMEGSGPSTEVTKMLHAKVKIHWTTLICGIPARTTWDTLNVLQNWNWNSFTNASPIKWIMARWHPTTFYKIKIMTFYVRKPPMPFISWSLTGGVWEHQHTRSHTKSFIWHIGTHLYDRCQKLVSKAAVQTWTQNSDLWPVVDVPTGPF